MRVSELASRYAKAIYDLAVEKKAQDRVFNELRQLEGAFARDAEVAEWMASPLVTEGQRETVMEKALTNSGASVEVSQFVMTLARKNRLSLFAEIVQAYEELSDRAHGVCRGMVRSATVLAPADRQKIEKIVEEVLKKKVIMTYKEDTSVIGGLVAQVGSYTFDDSLDAHLRRMNEELKRRTV